MNRLAVLAASLLFVTIFTCAPVHAARMGDWSTVDQALGRPGKDFPGGVHKFGFPRTDLKIALDGTPIRAPLALGSWVAFMPHDGGAMLMGSRSPHCTRTCSASLRPSISCISGRSKIPTSSPVR